MHAELVPGAVKPFTDEALRDPITRGFYLATIAHCMECHGRRPDGVQDYKNALGKGGYVFTGPWGAVVTPNITSHPKSGIGAWTTQRSSGFSLTACRATAGRSSSRWLVKPTSAA